MAQIVVIGCGVVGAAIAYELSRSGCHTITVLEQATPAQGASGAALGIAMGVISQKVKGRNWKLREASIRRYHTLLSELKALTGERVPHNDQGILSLCFDRAELPRWQSLQNIRQQQGWTLEIWSPTQVVAQCPHLNPEQVVAGIYSPQDLQIAPQALTQSLINGAQHHGTTLHTASPVVDFEHQGDRVTAVIAETGTYPADWVIVTAGLGSQLLTEKLGYELPLIPVLGQGIRVQMPKTLGEPTFQPVVNGNDVHLVPLGDGCYGVAATVEFPEPETVLPMPRQAALDQVWQQAVAYCPELASGTWLSSWHGLRPRPQGRPAPVIEQVENRQNVVVATGHYRNGVLLAPATAQIVSHLIQANA